MFAMFRFQEPFPNRLKSTFKVEFVRYVRSFNGWCYQLEVGKFTRNPHPPSFNKCFMISLLLYLTLRNIQCNLNESRNGYTFQRETVYLLPNKNCHLKGYCLPSQYVILSEIAVL